MGLLAVALAILLLQGPPGAAPGSAAGSDQEQQSQPPAGQSSGQTMPAPESGQPTPRGTTGTTSSVDLFSVERLRQELERKPTIIFRVRDANIPTFKVQIEGKRWQLPTLQQRMAKAIPKMAVQVPYGGTLAADMARLNTPPEFMGSSGFTNAEVAQLPLFALETWFGKAAIRKALEARHAAELARTREEIRQELAAVEEHNARVAAGLSDDGSSDPKKAVGKGKKKQDDAKKQEEKKKKKKDPGKS